MKALIFDLDGTLLNTLADLRDCTNFALKKFGFPTRTTEEIRNFVGNGLRMLIRRAVPDMADEATVDAVLSEMKAHYRIHFHDGTVPYDGVLEMLREFKQAGYPMAIVSNKADPIVQLLREVYFADLIDVAVGERSDLPRKPAPDMVHWALEQLGCKDGYYIGDSEVDVQTAKNAALPCFAVSWGFRSAAVLISAGAEHIFQTPQELCEAIRKRAE